MFTPENRRTEPSRDPKSFASGSLVRVYGGDGYQRELPGVETRGRFLNGGAPGRDAAGPGSLGVLLAEVAMWASVGAAAAVVVAILVLALRDASARTVAKRFLGHARDKRQARGTPGSAAASEAAPGDGAWLDVADALARQGQRADAIHALLLGVLTTLRETRGLNWPVAATSREIVARQSGRRAEHLGALVQRSELVRFGGRPASEGDYRDCRGAAFSLIGAPAPQSQNGQG